MKYYSLHIFVVYFTYQGKYPDLVSKIEQVHDAETTSFIIDCEVVAWCPKEKKILPFQVLTTRKRKDADENDLKVFQ